VPTLLSERPACTLLSSPEQWHEPEIQEAWERLLAAGDPLGAVYRSPGWFDHMNAPDAVPRSRLAVLRGPGGRIDGIVPLEERRVPIELYAGGRALTAAHVRVVDVLGGQPLVADDPVVYDALLSAATEAFPDCRGIRLADIPSDGPLFKHLTESAAVRERFLVCVFDGLAPYQTLPLPATFADYLAHFPRKKRYNLKRQERLLREHGNGQLELRRWDSPDDVPGLLKHLAALGGGARHDAAAWGGGTPSWFTDLAARNILRCYTLVCGEKPAAAMVGFQCGATYTIDTTLYDRRLARLSPGSTMTHLALEDLLTHRPVRLVDFGYGNPSHNQQPPRVPRSFAKVFLLRPTLPNRVRWAAIRAARATMRLVGGRFRRVFERDKVGE
jgi:CelD/BcsL family acetyltransferase involved in cellulose biosynthesis